MAIAAPSDEVTRLVEALGLRTKNTREVTLRMAVNEAVAVNAVEYVNGEQIGALAAELKERQYRLVRWIPVEERLPEEDEDVLVIEEDGGMLVANRNDRGGWGHSFGSGGPSDGRAWPTHWMPLPEPPRVK